MKSLLIVVLSLALIAAAFFTKPAQADFANYLKSRQAVSGTLLTGIVRSVDLDAYLQMVTYHDRLLWISVQKDGQTQYIGAFNHWFKSNRPPTAQ